MALDRKQKSTIFERGDENINRKGASLPLFYLYLAEDKLKIELINIVKEKQ